MKKKRLNLFLTLILPLNFGFLTIMAQTPQKMSYQAVVRNGSNQLVTNHAVGIKISILQGSASGTVVYTEAQVPTSNANGLISIEIGSETGFNNIDWSNGTYFIKTETDPTGGTNYTVTGTSQLLSLSTYMGGSSVAGGKLKETGTTHWTSPNIADNETGFSAVGGGYRIGTFANMGNYGDYWTSTTLSSSNAFYVGFPNTSTTFGINSYSKSLGAAVRCIRD